MIKAIIFDMDGVIVDSEPIHAKADKILMKEYGIDATDDFLDNYVGVAYQAMWTEIKEIYNIGCPIDELLSKISKIKIDLVEANKLEAIDGVRELIVMLKNKGIKVGLASSSPRDFIDLILGKLEIAEFFDVIVSGEDVANSKPAPDIFIKASTLLGVEPCECLVIEDSGHGVKAAKSAGMRCIGYVNANSGKQDLSAADINVFSIRDIDIDHLAFII